MLPISDVAYRSLIGGEPELAGDALCLDKLSLGEAERLSYGECDPESGGGIMVKATRLRVITIGESGGKIEQNIYRSEETVYRSISTNRQEPTRGPRCRTDARCPSRWVRHTC